VKRGDGAVDMKGKGTSGRSWYRELAHTPQHMNKNRQTKTWALSKHTR